jgi:hypothetical protein
MMNPNANIRTGARKKVERTMLHASLIASAAIIVAAVGSASPAYAKGGHGGGTHGGSCYIAASGNCVPRPTRATSPPPDATAHCADGSWSFSEHPASSGTCHGHGGVS